MTSKASVLAAAGVALVILIDLATGQGPPVYTNYLRGHQETQMMPPPPQPMVPIQAHMMPVQYEQPIDYAAGSRLDTEEVQNKFENLGIKHAKDEEEKDKYKYKKEEEKDIYKHNKGEEKGDEYKYNKEGESKTTKSPGLYDRIMKNFG